MILACCRLIDFQFIHMDCAAHELVSAQTVVIVTVYCCDSPLLDPSRSSEITTGFGFGLASQMLIYGRDLTLLIQDTAIQ
jgi:hypothetical protein